MKNGLPLLFLVAVAGCAHKPPTVDFLYKGMNKQLMLHVMGEPLQVIKTYQGQGPDQTEGKQFQFSNSRCEGGTKAVCSVSTTKDGVVYGWTGVKSEFTEDGQN